MARGVLQYVPTLNVCNKVPFLIVSIYYISKISLINYCQTGMSNPPWFVVYGIYARTDILVYF